MPTLYETLVFLHILTAVVWVGGAVAMQLLAVRAQRSGDAAAMARTAGDVEWVGMRVFMPSSAILLVVGIWAVIEGPWEFSQGWISAGFVVWFLSFFAGMGFLGPESGRVKALIGERGPESPEVAARLSRIFLVSRIELVLLVAIIFVMVAKPGL